MPFSAAIRPKKPRRRALIAIAVVGTLTALTGYSGQAAAAATTGKTLTIVEPDNNMGWSLDYAFSGLEQSVNTQATLLKKPYNRTKQRGVETQNASKFSPYLAKSMDVSSDGLVYTFHLRKHVVSTHGNKLTADDVKWSFERKYNTSTSVAYGVASPVWYDPEKQIKVIDASTVSFTLTSAGYGATFKALMSDLLGEVYDATYLKAHVTKADPYAVKFSATHPNFGFGPYKVQTWNQSSGATLVAKNNSGLARPDAKKIIVRIVPDSGARVTAVEDGTADIAENVDPAALAQAKSKPNVTAPSVSDSNQYIELPLVTNKAPFNNEKVRQAFAYAVDYKKIIKNVFHGRAVRNGSGFLDKQAPGYDGSGLPAYKYNPAKAKTLLKAAGVSGAVDFTLAVSSSDSDMVNTAIQIKSAASAAGFNVTIDKQSQSQFNEQRSNHTQQAFLLKDYAITMTPGYELMVYNVKGSTNNLADWEDQHFSDLVDKGYTYSDAFSSEAGIAWNAAEKYWIDSAPILFIGQTQPNVLLSSKVGGYSTRSDQWIDYSNLTLKK